MAEFAWRATANVPPPTAQSVSDSKTVLATLALQKAVPSYYTQSIGLYYAERSLVDIIRLRHR
jgi:hypothetical protein